MDSRDELEKLRFQVQQLSSQLDDAHLVLGRKEIILAKQAAIIDQLQATLQGGMKENNTQNEESGND